jgi:hypothetical protein
MKAAGIVLIVLGALALIYQGFDYTRHRNVIDVGPVHASVNSQEHVPIPPIMGGLALALGAVLLVAGAKKQT